jgi:hypothetical protein
MRVVVDNRTGSDTVLATEVATALEQRGHEVEVRQPDPARRHDTAVHLLSAGLVLRVAEPPAPADLQAMEEVVQGALSSRASLRRRTRAVPVHLGEGARVLRWIDVFG